MFDQIPVYRKQNVEFLSLLVKKKYAGLYEKGDYDEVFKVD